MTGNAFMKGNEAIAIGALHSGLNAYFGYPITPSTEVAETLAKEYGSDKWPDYKVYMQASSELEAINMVLGAASTGMRTMTFTASPGFSLKQEGISYGIGSEIPFVVGNVNRGGPGLGNLGAEQSDYWQVTRGGGHGGYRLPTFAPAGVQEILSFPGVAFDTAYKYRTPALLVFDSFTGQFKEDVQIGHDITKDLHRGAGPLDLTESYWDFDLTPDQWSIGNRQDRPNGERRIVNSLHLGNEAQEAHSKAVHDRWYKIEENEALWEEFRVDDAKVLIVSYGITSRISKAAISRMREDDEVPVGMLRPATINPFPARALANLATQVEHVVVVELNTGQMIHDVKAAMLGINPNITFAGVNHMGGVMPSQDEIIRKVKEVMS